tara:strand:- start:586 stop:807 length:222 start_codon:yes stop_codon:yes gene_type:complete
MSVSINLHTVTEITVTKTKLLDVKKIPTPTWTSELTILTSDGDEIIFDLYAESEEALFVHTDGTVVITGDGDE